MRISKHKGILWVFLFVCFSLSSLHSQIDFIHANTYFLASTEEIPEEDPIVANQTIPSNSYRVQLGLFNDPNNVNKLIDRVVSKFDLPLYIFLEGDHKKLLYRVVIGDFYSREAAKDIIPELRQNGVKGFVKEFNRWEDSVCIVEKEG